MQEKLYLIINKKSTLFLIIIERINKQHICLTINNINATILIIINVLKDRIMDKISNKQQQIFNFIKDFIDEKGTAPSVREIGEAVDLKSSSTVQYHIMALIDAGYLEKGEANQKRTLKLAKKGSNTYHVPLLGTVTAGKPILAVESIEDYIPVSINSKGKELFALRVKGDSMINAAICDGDIVIVERTPYAENGDIVVALIEDEATVKRFYAENGHFRLQPENENYEPIIVDELAVLGKIISLIRNYN